MILLDAGTVITGSLNLSKATEESNAENLLLIKGKDSNYAAYY